MPNLDGQVSSTFLHESKRVVEHAVTAQRPWQAPRANSNELFLQKSCVLLL